MSIINYRHTVFIETKDGKGKTIKLPVFKHKPEFENKKYCKSKKDIFDDKAIPIERYIPVYSPPNLFGVKKIIKYEKVLLPTLLCRKDDELIILSKIINDTSLEITYTVEFNHVNFLVKESDIILPKQKKTFSLDSI